MASYAHWEWSHWLWNLQNEAMGRKTQRCPFGDILSACYGFAFSYNDQLEIAREKDAMIICRTSLAILRVANLAEDVTQRTLYAQTNCNSFTRGEV